MKKLLSILTIISMLCSIVTFSVSADSKEKDVSYSVTKAYTNLLTIPSGHYKPKDDSLTTEYYKGYNLYKEREGWALFAAVTVKENYDSKFGYDWNAFLVSRDKYATYFGDHRKGEHFQANNHYAFEILNVTNSVEYNGETWYYTTAIPDMFVGNFNRPSNIFYLNGETKVEYYNNYSSAIIALLDYYFNGNSENKTENKTENKEENKVENKTENTENKTDVKEEVKPEIVPEDNKTDSTSEQVPSGNQNSCVITKKDTLLYALPKGGVDFPYERNYYKKYDGKALFATYIETNNDDSTGYDWYACVVVSTDKNASLYYTAPTDWMPSYGRTDTMEYRGENWYYTHNAAMHINEEDEPKDVFHLNDVTGVRIYKNAEEAAKDLIDYYLDIENKKDDTAKDENTEEKPVEDTSDKKDDAEEEKPAEDTTAKDEDTEEEKPAEDTTAKDEDAEEDKPAEDTTAKDEDVVEDKPAEEPEQDETEDAEDTTSTTNPNYGGIFVLINNIQISFDQPPIIENGRTLVPLRAIFEALGCEVDWDADTQTVTATHGLIQISLQINSTLMYVNGFEIPIDVPAKIVNNRTLVPVRAISESLGCDVGWDGDTRTVSITQ